MKKIKGRMLQVAVLLFLAVTVCAVMMGMGIEKTVFAGDCAVSAYSQNAVVYQYHMETNYRTFLKEMSDKRLNTMQAQDTRAENQIDTQQTSVCQQPELKWYDRMSIYMVNFYYGLLQRSPW